MVRLLHAELQFVDKHLRTCYNRFMEDSMVKEWLSQIQDLALEEKDIVDTFETKYGLHKRRNWAAKMYYGLLHAGMPRELERHRREVEEVENGVGSGDATKRTSEQKFKNRAWIFVPSKYRMRELLLGLLENLMSVGEEILKLDDVKLAEKLRKLLLGKRYLVVIDGVEKAQLKLITYSYSSSPIPGWKGEVGTPREVSVQRRKLPGTSGEQIAAKCDELPLAIVSLAGMLSLFGAYPSDCEIPARQIINLWIAEVLAKGNNEPSAEQIAERYLDELIDLCLIEVARKRSDGDHIHELRYILSDPNYLSHLHSLLCFHNNGSLDSDEFTLKFDHLPNISALDLGSTYVPKLGGSIKGSLVLKYLTINHPSLKRLPSSLCNLSDQQTLDIKNTCVKCLQCGIWEMQKLRHLSVPHQTTLPKGTFPTRLVKVTLVRTGLVADDVMRTLEKLGLLQILLMEEIFIQTWRMGDGAMGSLEELTLSRCHELKSLPHQLWQLHDMHQIKVNSPSHCLKRELEQLRAEKRKVHIHF
ncbi:hypothetical protein Godav_007667 [Gossypium davidsonii]|uniref:Rx N-terminal domain-containing protein n=1 Tax=Gossypium davidsonii TaxID=34287 RepID=A0A7J8S7U0_GOSDV|nr:hypothetical protein [Gossypium davidsonii]